MSAAGIPSVLPPSTKHPVTHDKRTTRGTQLLQILGFNFSVITWLLVGACVQSILYLALHTHFRLQAYIALVAFGLLGSRILNAVLIAKGYKPNPLMQDLQLGRRAAFVPDTNGIIPDKASENIVVMILGTKSNHPYGIFAPMFKGMGEHMNNITAAFSDPDSPPKGFLGQTNWWRNDERGAVELVWISYWRTLEDVHNFSHGPEHRAAWDWWNKSIKQLDAVGIMHEMYEVPAGHWENIYVNFQPNSLGATSVLRKADGSFEKGQIKNEDEWITPLVDARRGKLAKSSQRMGHSDFKYDGDHVAPVDAY